jgi:hypothetical protein
VKWRDSDSFVHCSKGHENNYISSGVQKDEFGIGGQGLEPSNGTHNY